jgi:putative hemolysin
MDAKNPRLRKWLPGFIQRYIKRIVHEQDINGVMARIGHLKGMAFLEALLTKELHTNIVLKGAENIPTEGGCIIASNHPLGGLDGLALMYAVGQVRTDFQFLVNDILLNIKNLEQFFIPVNKVGDNPRAATRLIEETYAKEIPILVFPAGLVSRKQPQGIEDLEWKKSFIAKAVRYNKPILPTYIDGRNSNWFYNLSNFRRKLGVKANLEMFYLADELFKQRNQTITITFGAAIQPTHFDKSKSHQDWATELRTLVYGELKRASIQ